MVVFRQLGDPLAAAECLCQHHQQAYAERVCVAEPVARTINYDLVAADTALVSCPITTTERCCIAVNAAILTTGGTPPTNFEIERPVGTIRTTQEDSVPTGQMAVLHHAAWEVLDPGTYTYHLMNRGIGNLQIYAAWLKIIASDCEG